MRDITDFKKILIFRTGHLGDTLVALPALWSIRKAFPNAKLTFLTNVDARNPHYVFARNVLPENGLIDDWLSYPTNLSKIGMTLALIELSLEIRRAKFDCVFYLMTRNRTIARIRRDERFFRLSRLNEIFGTEFLIENRIDENAPKPLPEIVSESQFLLNCLPSKEFSFDLRLKTELLLSPEERDFAESWLKRNCKKAFTEKRLLAIAPGSKWNSKIWSEERFFETVRSLIENHDVFPVVFGGVEDREKGNRLIEKWQRGANAAGELTIRQSAAALAHCKLYLGNDSGTMHLAAAVGTPCVGIFSAVDYPGRWIPFGKNNITFREKIECEGCYLELCPIENKCLAKIPTEKVLTACESIWTSVQSRNASS